MFLHSLMVHFTILSINKPLTAPLESGNPEPLEARPKEVFKDFSAVCSLWRKLTFPYGSTDQSRLNSVLIHCPFHVLAYRLRYCNGKRHNQSSYPGTFLPKTISRWPTNRSPSGFSSSTPGLPPRGDSGLNCLSVSNVSPAK